MINAKNALKKSVEIYNAEALITMCDVVERIRNDGRTEEKERIIMNLIESNAGTIEQIAAWVKLPVKEVQKIAKKVPVNA